MSGQACRLKAAAACATGERGMTIPATLLGSAIGDRSRATDGRPAANASSPNNTSRRRALDEWLSHECMVVFMARLLAPHNLAIIQTLRVVVNRFASARIQSMNVLAPGKSLRRVGKTTEWLRSHLRTRR